MPSNMGPPSLQEIRALQLPGRLTELFQELPQKLRRSAPFDLVHVRVLEARGELAERPLHALAARTVNVRQALGELRDDDGRVANRAREVRVEQQEIHHVAAIDA